VHACLANPSPKGELIAEFVARITDISIYWRKNFFLYIFYHLRDGIEESYYDASISHVRTKIYA
jgi:hypothetical protein